MAGGACTPAMPLPQCPNYGARRFCLVYQQFDAVARVFTRQARPFRRPVLIIVTQMPGPANLRAVSRGGLCRGPFECAMCFGYDMPGHEAPNEGQALEGGQRCLVWASAALSAVWRHVASFR